MQELILGNVAVMVSQDYSSKEKAVIKELSQGAVIDVVIPDTIEASDFHVALDAVCKVIVRAEMQKESLIPALGRLLYIASTHPELYQDKYETFDDLVASLGQRFGVGRSTCFDAKAFWGRWSTVLPSEEYKTVGRVKLKMLSQAIDKGKEAQKRSQNALAYAKEHTAAELEEYLEKEFHQPSGSTTGATFKFTSSKAANKRITKWFEDPRVAAYCGTDDVAAILELMIAECSGEWVIAGQQKIDELAGQAEVLNESEEVPEPVGE